MTDHLTTDFTKVKGQEYALISWVGPKNCPQRHESYGIKLRGTFPTKADASLHSARLHKDDPRDSIYVVEMYKWIHCWPGELTKEESDKILEAKREAETGIVAAIPPTVKRKTVWLVTTIFRAEYLVVMDSGAFTTNGIDAFFQVDIGSAMKRTRKNRWHRQQLQSKPPQMQRWLQQTQNDAGRW